MRFLKLAASNLYRQVGDPFIRPYGVDVSVSAPLPAVVVSEGITHDAVASVVTVAEALATWRQHLARADGVWLVPFLERLGLGEQVDERELVDAFGDQHGREPEAYEWDVPVGPWRERA